MTIKKLVGPIVICSISMILCVVTFATSLGNINAQFLIFIFKIILLAICIIGCLKHLMFSKFTVVSSMLYGASLVLIIASLYFPTVQIPDYYKKAMTVRKIHSGKLYNSDYIFNPAHLYHGANLNYKDQRMIYGGKDGHEDVLFIYLNTERKEDGIYYYDGHLYSEDHISEAETFMHGPVEMIEINDGWYKVVVELSP